MASAIVTWVPLALLTALLALTLRSAWRSWAPLYHMLGGRYPEAQQAAQRMGQSFLRALPSVRFGARYMVALSLHMQGELDACLDELAALPAERLDDNLRYAAWSLEASTLVLLDRDPARALASIERAIALWPASPEDLLIRALAHQARGHDAEARADFDRAESARRPRTKLGARTALVEDRETKRAIAAYLRALFLARAGDEAAARAELEKAAAHPRQHVYAELARRGLPPRAKSEDEGPSSLAPQVLGRVDGGAQGGTETPSSEKRKA